MKPCAALSGAGRFHDEFGHRAGLRDVDKSNDCRAPRPPWIPGVRPSLAAGGLAISVFTDSPLSGANAAMYTSRTQRPAPNPGFRAVRRRGGYYEPTARLREPETIPLLVSGQLKLCAFQLTVAFRQPSARW